MPGAAAGDVLFALALASASLTAAPSIPSANAPGEGPAAEAPPPRADDDRHGWVEARLGGAGLSSDASMRFGPSAGVAFGTAFKWLDLGLVGRYATVTGEGVRLTTFGAGPEIATRKRLGAGATLRLGIAPEYVFAFGDGAHARYGAEATAQLFFTLEESTATFLRAGLGLRAGRFASVSRGDPAGWSLGVDMILRSFW